ncbi:MAG: glycoside hydrolase family 2 TIM barrel-domain containing protein [bacterium]
MIKQGRINQLSNEVNTYYASYNSLEEAKLSKEQNKISINDEWEFAITNSNESQKLSDVENLLNNNKKIVVPGAWELQNSTEVQKLRSNKEYGHIKNADQSYGIYRKEFNIPTNWLSRETFICFEAISSKFEIWLNYKKIGSGEGFFTSKSFNISNYLVAADNNIIIKVAKSDKDVDGFDFSGLLREVFIYSIPKTYIQDFHTYTNYDEHNLATMFNIRLLLNNTSKKKTAHQLQVIIKEDDKKEDIKINGRLVLEPESSKEYFLHKEIIEPKMWSSEEPNLYDVYIVLKNYKGEEIEVKKIKFGFKNVKIQNEKLWINEKPVVVKGINFNPINPITGLYLTEQDYEQEIIMMKQHNINAVRTSLCPPDSRFYDLCDKYGIYIINEMNIKGEKIDVKIERTKGLIYRDKNHPSVIMWSIESDLIREQLVSIKKAIKSIDENCTLHFSGINDLGISDVVSFEYKFWECIMIKKEIENNNKVVKSQKDNKIYSAKNYYKKPVLFCEEFHSLENSISNLKCILKQVEEQRNCIGCFIGGDFQQKTFEHKEGKTSIIHKHNLSKEMIYNYYDNNGFKVKNNPIICEIKKLYQNIIVESMDIKEGKFRIHNKNIYLNLEDLYLKWELTKDGVIVEEGIEEDVLIPPGDVIDLEIEYNYLSFIRNGDYQLTLMFKFKKDCIWAKKDYEIAWEQFPIISNNVSPSLNITYPLKVKELRRQIEIIGNNFEIVVDKQTGIIKRYIINKINILNKPIRPNYLRVITNRDIKIKKNLKLIKKWQRNKISIKDIIVQEEENFCRIIVLCKSNNFKGKFKYTYTITGQGQILVEHCATPKIEMLRMGMQLELESAFNQMKFYGRGPEENYPDNNTGYKIGLYDGQVEDFIFDYKTPQENGNHTDVSWLELTDIKGNGIKISRYEDEYLNISVWPYRMKELEKANNNNELPKNYHCIVNVDHYHKGINDYSYDNKLSPKTEYKFVFLIEPIRE